MPERRGFHLSEEEIESQKLNREPKIEVRGDEVMIGFNQKELAYLDTALKVHLEAEQKTQADWEERKPDPEMDEKFRTFHIGLIEKLIDRIKQAVEIKYEANK